MMAPLNCSFCAMPVSVAEARSCKKRDCPVGYIVRTSHDALRQSGHVQDSLGRWAKRA